MLPTQWLNMLEKQKIQWSDFKEVQQKMFVYLSTLGLALVLEKNLAPQVEPPAGRSRVCANCKIAEAGESRQAHMVEVNVDMIAMVVLTCCVHDKRVKENVILKDDIEEELKLLKSCVLGFATESFSVGLAVKQLYEVDREVNTWLHSPSFVRTWKLDTSFTAPYSSSAKLVLPERKNRTLEKNSYCQLISYGNEQDMWGEAKVAVPTPKAQKIGPKSVDCIFIGYAKKSTAYRFIVHESKNTIRMTKLSKIRDKVMINDLQDERQEKPMKKEVEPRRSKRTRNEKSFGPDFVSFMVENEPTSYREAVTSSEGQQWREAIKSEIEIIFTKPYVGARQAPQTVASKLDHTMLESGFKINECDKCVYVKDTSAGYVILCLYVDDMLIVGSNDKIIRSTKDMLKSKFDMKDMGLADVILGIKIIRTQNGLVLSQAHYVDKILNTHNAGDSGQARTPIDTSTRPDLAYAVSRLSRYTSNPSYAHWKAITRVLHYLRYSRDYGTAFEDILALYLGSLPSKLFIAKSRWNQDLYATRYAEKRRNGYVNSPDISVVDITRYDNYSQLGVYPFAMWRQRINIADPFKKGLKQENQASAHDHDGHDYEDLTRCLGVFAFPRRELARSQNYVQNELRLNEISRAQSEGTWNTNMELSTYAQVVNGGIGFIMNLGSCL
ncbi:retrotransposon protein, putative, ty1-copia subclass [Tanacetum coccineum]